MDYKKILFEIANVLGMSDLVNDEVKMAEHTLDDGTIVYTADGLDLGVQVFEDMELTIVLKDGTYKTVEKTFIITEGIVSEITETETETIVEQEEVKVEEVIEEKKFSELELVDGGIIYYDGELAKGIVIFSESGMTEVLIDGEYITVNGEVIVIKEGVVDTITSVMEQNTMLKKLLKEINIDLKDKDDQINEMSVNLSKFKEIEKTLKEKLSRTPITESIKFSSIEEVVENKVDKIKQNRKELSRNLRGM